jgi:hypothetical protein
MFGLCVKSGRRLIEKEDARLADQGTSDCNPLLLAATQLHSSLANFCIISVLGRKEKKNWCERDQSIVLATMIHNTGVPIHYLPHRHSPDERIGVCEPCGFFNLLLCRLFISAFESKHQVSPDASSKERWLLTHNRNVSRQPFWTELVYLVPIQENSTRRMLIHVSYQ